MATARHLPDAPAIPGLSFRSIRGAEDTDALYAVHQGRRAHDRIDPLSTLEDVPARERLQASLAAAAAEGRQDRWLVAEVGGQVVGYSCIASWPEADGTWVYLTRGYVLPAWRGRGIGTAMLHWTEERIRGLAAVEHPGERAELAANASSTEVEATEVLRHEGYTAGYTVLEMGLDAAVPVVLHGLPAGLDVRPVLPQHYTLIAASVDEAYRQEYDGGRFGERFDPAAYVAELSQAKHDPSLWQVGWDGDQVAGQVLSVVENGRAEVFEVSVRPAWRRRGLARALLSRALAALRAREVEVIRLHTVSDFRTRAKDLYRSAGLNVLKEFPRYRKPLDLSPAPPDSDLTP